MNRAGIYFGMTVLITLIALASLDQRAPRTTWQRDVNALTTHITALAAGLSLDQILQRHIEAVGGRDRIDALQSLIIQGVYREGPFQTDAFIAKMRPYYKTLADPKDLTVDINEGFDGSAWEYYRDPGVVLRTVRAAAAATRHGTYLIDWLVDYKSQGSQLKAVGTEFFEGHPAYRLHLTLADGFEQDVFLDQQSFLILGDRRSAPIHAFGEAVRSENRISDYRPVNGVLLPYLSEEVEASTGKVMNSLEVKTITGNPPLDPNFFGPPQFTRTPLQEFLEQLYVQRDDPVSVMWTYHRFRNANSRLDTCEGVEFIGYQMAKMRAFDSSIELLSANVADYPESAGAQFGLGRAYQAAGDRAHARQAFAAALRIDPHFEKARDGINALK